MRILVLQLKRIGDLILTTPALTALRTAFPQAHIALGVSGGAAALLPAVTGYQSAIVFGKGRGFAPWQQTLTGGWDVCLDFTGTDRSALATALARAGQRVAFSSSKKSPVRAFAYNRFVDSPVRDSHTVDRHVHLLRALSIDVPAPAPSLRLPGEAERDTAALLPPGPYAVVHAGAARPEKCWPPEHWAQLISHLHRRYPLACVLTGGNDPRELAHLAEIQSALRAAGSPEARDLAGQLDLPGFVSVLARARIVLSCDTAAVHVAAAFQRPQVALFGPTNPFHWRPRHDQATVLSAAQPAA
ncbi:MAG: glycosyltransferase family 9 protein, partial [Verrucomicrobiota bacterium]|nr:glycosyltransferase family 9 protein [Verrucomicrobiota bacterium]